MANRGWGQRGLAAFFFRKLWARRFATNASAGRRRQANDAAPLPVELLVVITIIGVLIQRCGRAARGRAANAVQQQLKQLGWPAQLSFGHRCFPPGWICEYNSNGGSLPLEWADRILVPVSEQGTVSVAGRGSHARGNLCRHVVLGNRCCAETRHAPLPVDTTLDYLPSTLRPGAYDVRADNVQLRRRDGLLTWPAISNTGLFSGNQAKRRHGRRHDQYDYRRRTLRCDSASWAGADPTEANERGVTM